MFNGKWLQRKCAEKDRNQLCMTKNKNRQEETEPSTNTVIFPWIPGVGPKLRKIFKKAGFKAVFQSNRNLKTILSSEINTHCPRIVSLEYTPETVDLEKSMSVVSLINESLEAKSFSFYGSLYSRFQNI